MKRLLIYIFAVLFLLTAYVKADTKAVQIFLHRESVINSDRITIGSVAVVNGDDELTEEISGIGLGIISMPGQEVEIDRQTIKSRLLASGVSLDGIKILGAEKSRVKMQEILITPEEIISLAENFAKEHFEGSGATEFTVQSMPAKVVVAGNADDVSISPKWMSKGNSNRASVRIDIYKGESKVASRDVNFRLSYELTQLVAKRMISPGEVITADNSEIKKSVSNSPASQEPQSLYGMAARTRINAGSAIKSSMLESPKEIIVVKRNDLVDIKYETAALVVTALGQAMQDGRVGEIIKVANVKMDDNGRTVKGRVIAARVGSDGTVRPVF